MRTLFFSLCLVAAHVQIVSGQDEHATISGFVYDASNGEALIGANVYLAGAQIGGFTNISGYYVIPRIPGGTDTLMIRYIGYEIYKQGLTLAPGDQKTISVKLKAGNLVLETVEVTEDAIPSSIKLFEKEISNFRLTPLQLKQIPQVAEADLFRSVQTLPGILPVSDFSSALYVRGGTPDQNLYLMDGTDVYNPEHAFGLFSTFNTDAIKQVDLSKGGFGAKYGGRLSSVLNVTNLDGNREHFEGAGSISLLSAKTTIQTPIGHIGSLSGSIRRTYYDQTVARFAKSLPNYYFLDGNLKAYFDLNEKNKVTISGFGSTDKLNVTFNHKATNKAGSTNDWGNSTGSFRWTRIISPQLFANFWVTGSRFNSLADNSQTFDSAFTEKNFISDFSIKGDLEYYASEAFRLGMGFEQKNLHMIFRHQSESGFININRRPKHYAGYLLGNWQPSNLWEFEAGLRYNIFDSDKTFKNAAPRFSAKFRLTDTFTLKAATGQYFQYLHRVPRSFIADNWVASNKIQNESSSRHAIFGISKDVAEHFQIEVEAYYKDYKNIYDFNENFTVDITPESFNGSTPVYTQTDGLFNRGDGDSKGLEFLLRKDQGITTGWLGYTLSSTQYTFDGINQNRAFSPRHDRTHVMNLAGSVDLKNFRRMLRGESPVRQQSNWRMGATFVYTSGQPITVPGSTYFVNTVPDWDFISHEVIPTKINELRLPAYIRLDLSFTYEKHYTNWSIFPYLQILNVGNRKNIWFIDYDAAAAAPGQNFNSVIDKFGMFPILPTIGVNFKF